MLGVKSGMKRAWVLVVVGAVFLAASASHFKREASRTPEPVRPNPDGRVTRRVAESLASRVNDLQATHGLEGSRAAQPVGDLWLEVNRLKREGQNVRTIEWYVSDLEGSLRLGQQDAVARRHILNNLSYEVERLKQRPR
jgi:hypothetical protein